MGTDDVTRSQSSTVTPTGSVPVASSRIRDTKTSRYRVTHESVAEAQARRQEAIHQQNLANQAEQKRKYDAWLAGKKEAKANRDYWGEFNNGGIIASESWDAAGKAVDENGNPVAFDKLKYANAMSNINSYFGKNKDQAEKFRGLLSGAKDLFKEDGSLDWSKVTSEDQYRMILGKAKNVRDGARSERQAAQRSKLRDAEERQVLLNTLREHGIDNKFDQNGKSVYSTDQLRQMTNRAKLTDVTKALIALRNHDSNVNKMISAGTEYDGVASAAERRKLMTEAWQKGTAAGLKTNDMFRDDGSTRLNKSREIAKAIRRQLSTNGNPIQVGGKPPPSNEPRPSNEPPPSEEKGFVSTEPNVDPKSRVTLKSELSDDPEIRKIQLEDNTKTKQESKDYHERRQTLGSESVSPSNLKPGRRGPLTLEQNAQVDEMTPRVFGALGIRPGAPATPPEASAGQRNEAQVEPAARRTGFVPGMPYGLSYGDIVNNAAGTALRGAVQKRTMRNWSKVPMRAKSRRK